MLKATVKRRYTRGSVAERLIANSVISDGHGNPPQPKPCRLTTYALNEHGYGVIRLGSRTSKTHIEAYRAWVGPIPPGLDVMHLCNVTQCFEPTHLVLGNEKQNMAYMAACGRSNLGKQFPNSRAKRGDQHPTRLRPEVYPRGERSNLSKLTEDQVREIRHLAAQGQTHRQIANQFDINYANVSYIVRRKTWAHVQEAV